MTGWTWIFWRRMVSLVKIMYLARVHNSCNSLGILYCNGAQASSEAVADMVHIPMFLVAYITTNNYCRRFFILYRSVVICNGPWTVLVPEILSFGLRPIKIPRPLRITLVLKPWE